MNQGVNSKVTSVKVDVHADERAGPGWAHLRVYGLVSSSTQAVGEMQFSLQRNQDNRYLAERGQWSPSEVWHRSQSVSETDDGLALLMGPELVDELLTDPRAVYRIHLRLGAQSWTGVMRMARGVYPSGAAGRVPDASRQAQASVLTPTVASQDVAQEVVQEVVKEEAVSEPSRIEPPADQLARRKRIPILLLLLLLAVLGGVIWYLVWTQQASQAPASQSVSGAAGEPCSPQAMRAATDDLLFLQSCVQTKPDTKAVMAVIAAGKQAGRCDLIQRLYAHQSQAGNVEVTLAYAREFDPQTFSGGCFKESDPATALYWYDAALKLEPDRDDVVARVKALEAMK